MHEQFGRYVLLERIAVGGMAEIFRAKAPGLGGFEKILAIKRLHPRYSQDAEFIDMLIDEARITAELSHSNIAQIFDLAKVEDHYFIAMEFIDGRDLYRIMKKTREQQRRLPIEAAAYVAMEAAAGLDFAHRKKDRDGKPLNIVHRDVSPQNVLVSFEGEVKVVDFGIAKAAVRAHETEAGIIKGKFYYMSPEQARGEVLDHRTDIFSLGIVLYEMVTGELLYKDDDEITLLSQVRRAEVEPPSLIRPEIPSRLEQIIMRALARDRADRYPSAQHLQKDLARFLRNFDSNYTRIKLAQLMQDIHSNGNADGESGSVDSMRDRSDFVHDVHSLISAASFNDGEDHTVQENSILDSDSGMLELGSDMIELGSDMIELVEDSSVGPAPIASPGAQAAQSTVEVDSMDSSVDFFEEAPTRAFERDEPEPVIPAPASRREARRPDPSPSPAARRSRQEPKPSPAARRSRQEPSPSPVSETREMPRPNRRGDDVGGGVVDFNEQSTSILPDEQPTAVPGAQSARLRPVGEGAVPGRAVSQAPSSPPLVSREWLYVVAALFFIVLGAYTITTLLISDDEPDSKKGTVLRISGTGGGAPAPGSTGGKQGQAAVAPKAASQGAATLSVRSTPAGAKLQINGVWEFETTPTRIRVNSGEPIKLIVAQQRYRKYESTITLRAGELRELDIELDPLVGQLQVESVPSNATVFVQGNERGRTPVTLSRVPLDKTLRVRVMKDGFKTFDKSIDWADADDGQTLRVTARLEPAREPIAKTPRKPRRKRVRASSRSRSRRAAPSSSRRRGSDRGRAAPRSRSRAGGRGLLNVGTKPWGQIFVDGRLAHPEGPLVDYELSAGRHRVYVCFQGDRSRCTSPRTVVIRPGKTTRLNIR